MRHIHPRSLVSPVFLLAALALGAGCSSPPPPAPKEPEPPAPKPATSAEQEIPKEPVESNLPCAKGEAQCGGGVCAVTLHNTCDKPVSCEFAVLTVCQAETDLVQAKSKTRDTFAVGSKDSVSVHADCAAGRVVSTKIESLTCK